MHYWELLSDNPKTNWLTELVLYVCVSIYSEHICFQYQFDTLHYGEMLT